MNHGDRRIRNPQQNEIISYPHKAFNTITPFIIRKKHKTLIYLSKVQAGFPSPADDHIEDALDLNEHLIKHPSSTFMLRAAGDSMIGIGIFPGNILIIDRSLEACHGSIVIAAINGELTVKRLFKKNNITKLQAENPNYPDLLLSNDQEIVIWGVVTSTIVKFT